MNQKEKAAHPDQSLSGDTNSVHSEDNTILADCQVTGASKLEALLQLVSAGKPLFPCNLNKSPCTTHGYKDASIDPEQIKAWHKEWADALWGMCTGEASGYMVLDIDLPDGEKTLAALEAENGSLPETVEVSTPSGGRHLYFKHVPGVRISAGERGVGKNLDIRAEGGYIIVPPSKGYRFVKGGLI